MATDKKSSDAWNPQQYEKFKNERSQPFFDLMTLLQPKENAAVIDLGCGTGELTADLHRTMKAKHTLGVDSSEEMLKKAQAFQKSGIEFQLGDIQTWSASNQYDVVFSNAAIQWCEEHRQIFAHIKKSLKPGGQVAVQMPMNFDYPTHTLAAQMSLEKPWAQLLGKEKYDKQNTMLTAEAYAKLLFDLGFTQQNVFLKVYGHILESREGVIEWVKGTLLTHFKSRLSTQDYEKFLKEFRERLFQELPDDKPFFYPFKRIFIWGLL